MGSQTQTPVVVELKGDTLKPGSASWLASCTAIRHAVEQHGFFIVEYDGLPLQLREAILSDTEHLFRLPYDTKIKNTSDKSAHGYVGNIGSMPIHESVAIDHATNLDNCNNFSNLMWPDSGNHSFSKNAHTFAMIISELEQTVVRMLFESYGLRKEVCDGHVGAATYLLRFLKYRKPESDEPQVGLGTHTDKTFISVLHQNQVRGLEMQMGDGNWVWFDDPSPTAFVVMAGDACMAWSNDRVKSCYHRVMMDRNEESVRYALGLFSFQSKVIETPQDLVDEDHPLQYKPFDHLGLVKFMGTADVSIRATRAFVRAYCGISII